MKLQLLPSGGASINFLQANVPEVQQSVVFIGTEVCKVFQQAVSHSLVTQSTGPPGFCQHGVVGPIEANPIFTTDRPLVGGCSGVPASTLLPTGILSFGVWQL